MMTLPQYKALLGSEATHQTDDEILESMEAMYQFAEMAFSLWVEEKTLNTKTPEFTNKM